MKWIVGLDLRPLSQGALQMVRWLAACRGAAGADETIGLHILEEEHLRLVLRYHHLDEVVQAARDEAARAVERGGASALVRDVRVLQATTADAGLEAERARLQAGAIVIGRRARREGHQLVRLGRVARHLLDRSAAPVLVVPPDLELAHLGDGPIVALTRAGEGAAGLCRFSARLAERLGRKLTLLHVVPAPEDHDAMHLAPETVERMRRDLLSDGEKLLAGWAGSQGLGNAALAVRQGPVVETACLYAAERGSPLLVAGTHPRSTLERLLATGVGTELAAAAALPVAVVPSAAVAAG